jgi:hypothetical protein
VPFFIGKRYRGSFDSRHEIPEKPADSPEARFDGEMMAPPYSIPAIVMPGIRHPAARRQSGADSGGRRHGGQPLGLRRALPAKIGGAGGLEASTPLRSAAC